MSGQFGTALVPKCLTDTDTSAPVPNVLGLKCLDTVYYVRGFHLTSYRLAISDYMGRCVVYTDPLKAFQSRQSTTAVEIYRNYKKSSTKYNTIKAILWRLWYSHVITPFTPASACVYIEIVQLRRNQLYSMQSREITAVEIPSKTT